MRDRAKRAAIPLILTLLLSLGMYACGGESSSSSSAENPSSETAGSEQAASDLSGTVTVWDPAYEDFPTATKAADQLDAEFEQLNPGVTIDHVAQPLEGYEEALRTSFASRHGPDVMRLLIGHGLGGVLNYTKGLERLNDRIPTEMHERLEFWEGMESDGNIYGVPRGLQGFVFYYNKKMFAEAGLPAKFHPTSWDELEQAGEKLKAAGIQPFTGGNKEGYENEWWFTAGWAAANSPEELVELENGDMSFTDPAVTTAFEPNLQMQNAGLFPADRFSAPLFTEGTPSFYEEDGAMFLGLISIAANYEEFIENGVDEKNLGWFPVPGASQFPGSAGSSWSIPQFAANKDAAWAYIEFITSKQSVETTYKIAGDLPNQSGIPLKPNAPIQEKEILQAISEMGVSPSAEQQIPASVVAALDTEMNEVLQGRQSLSGMQQILQEEAEKTHAE